MRAVGIVTEFNPFHNGHALLIERARAMLEDDAAVVCAMSGDFVQRGEAAVWSKFARAEAAARSGADLVFELPVPWALSSAEGFARGGVGLLASLGVVDCICFGSECGEAEPLERAAEALLSPKFAAALKDELAVGAPFAAARQRALAAVTDEQYPGHRIHPCHLRAGPGPRLHDSPARGCGARRAGYRDVPFRLRAALTACGRAQLPGVHAGVRCCGV